MTDDDIREIFDERAAIAEFDGGFSRSHAEYLAARHVAKVIRPMPLPEWIRALLKTGKTS